MNVLKIVKGSDVTIKVNGEELCFVTDFSAKENRSSYEIEEILSDECFDEVNEKTDYTITLLALSMMDGSVFEDSPFTLDVLCDGVCYQYLFCVLKEKQRDINGSKPLTDKYVITAKVLRVIENA